MSEFWQSWGKVHTGLSLQYCAKLNSAPSPSWAPWSSMDCLYFCPVNSTIWRTAPLSRLFVPGLPYHQQSFYFILLVNTVRPAFHPSQICCISALKMLVPLLQNPPQSLGKSPNWIWDVPPSDLERDPAASQGGKRRRGLLSPSVFLLNLFEFEIIIWWLKWGISNSTPKVLTCRKNAKIFNQGRGGLIFEIILDYDPNQGRSGHRLWLFRLVGIHWVEHFECQLQYLLGMILQGFIFDVGTHGYCRLAEREL